MAQHDKNLDSVQTLAGLFRARVALSPSAIAYHQYDTSSSRWKTTNWEQMAVEVGRWQAALQQEDLKPGDRVAIMLHNSREWVLFDQAALGLGLVTVPLYVEDRADNITYVLADANARLLLIDDQNQWNALSPHLDHLPELKRIISVQTLQHSDTRLQSLTDWLFGMSGSLQAKDRSADSLASIVYTSGTSGRPKGVMLSHGNILSNAKAAGICAGMRDDDVLLSFLPLSHMLERTAGYYLPMLAGAEIAYARSIKLLSDDLQTIKPTIIITVPRIFERSYSKLLEQLEQGPAWRSWLFKLGSAIGYQRFLHQQGRSRWSPRSLFWPWVKRHIAAPVQALLGGRLRFAVVGGAALSADIAKTFISLDISLLQGYGLTEASPVVSVNRHDNNLPASIGPALPGVSVRIGENDELQVQGPNVMQGYWKNDAASASAFTTDGWLRTGDKARFDEQQRLYITGRIKDILVLANGEKLPPADLEMAITLDPLFEQALVVGEARPYLTALLVLNRAHWAELAGRLQQDPNDPHSLEAPAVVAAVQQHLDTCIKQFPGYAQIRRSKLLLEPWTLEAGLVTPTLKLKRQAILAAHAADIETLYDK